MRRRLAASFVVLGGTSLVAQVLVLRELLYVFYGNEFFMGWTLFTWLFWVSVGAWGAGRWASRARAGAGALAGCHAGAALALPAALAVIRAARLWVTPMAGAMPNLPAAMGYAFAVLMPLCVVLGAQFVAGAQVWRQTPGAGDAGRVQGLAYGLETAGFVAAGLAFNFFAVAREEFAVAGWLGGLNALAAWGVLTGAGPLRRRTRAGLLAWAGGALALAVCAGRIGTATAAWRYPGQVLVESRNSIHGNLAVTKLGAQINFHSHGLLLGAEEEQMAGETLAHYPMLWHPRPGRVLLLGNGFNGALEEILKHGPERVDYVETDPALIELVRSHAGPARIAALDDPRVRVVFGDGRAFFCGGGAGGGGDYDVVIVNLPNPGTILINRYYTREFYEDARGRLAPGGVLAVQLAFSPDYLGPELETLGASIVRTLGPVFGGLSVLPDYDLLLLATKDDAVAPDAEELARRYEERGLETDFVFPAAMAERLTTDRIPQVRAAFAANTAARVNRDDRPIACHYNLTWWLRSFHPRAAAFMARLERTDWRWGAGLAVLAALGLAARARGPGAGLWAKGIGSFSLMGFELVLLLAYQSLRGHLHYRLALLLAALMLGMALGTLAGTRRGGRPGPRTLSVLHAGMAVYALALGGVLRWMAATGSLPWMEGLFVALAVAAGTLAGCQFPAANGVYVARAARAGGGRLGAVYAVDVAASSAGALLVGLWALPVLGGSVTLGLLAGANALAALAVLAGGREV